MIRWPKKSKLSRLMLSVIPALIVFGLVYAADVYYDLDATKVIMNQVYRILQDLEVVGISTTTDIFPSSSNVYTLGAVGYQWANIYTSTTTFGGGLYIDIDDIKTTSGGDLTITAAGDLTVTSTDVRLVASVGDFSATSSQNIILATAAGERVRVSSSGNVGVATTTPSYKFQVWGSAGFGTSTTPTLYVDSGNGNVGIGTTAPVSNLNVSGAASNPVANTQTGIFRIGTPATTGLNIGVFTASPYGTWIQTTNQPATLAGTFPLVLNPLGGNVGIGTAGPSEILTVFSATDPTFQIGSGEATTTIVGNATSTFAVGVSTTAIKITNAPTSGFVLTSNAEGYGTWQAAPSADGGSNWQFVSANAIRPTSSAVGIIVNASSTFNNYLSVGTSTAPALFVDSGNGRIGMGTSTLADKLHVAGFVRTDDVTWAKIRYFTDFGLTTNVEALAVYRNKLYAGLTGLTDGDGDVYVYDGSTWLASYNNTANEATHALAVYNGRLYAGHGDDVGDGNITVFNGSTWTSSYNGDGADIYALAVYNDKLYAGQSTPNGILVFDGSTWSTSTSGIATGNALATYNGKLYAGAGATVLVFDGSSWKTSTTTAGSVVSFAVYNGKLYAGSDGTYDHILVFDGSTWSISRDGSNNAVESLAVYNNRLYAGERNNCDVLVFDGSTWSTSYDGSCGLGPYSLAVYNGKLFAGTNNDAGVYVYSERLEAQLSKEFYPGYTTPFNEQYQNFTKDITINASSSSSTASSLTVTQYSTSTAQGRVVKIVQRGTGSIFLATSTSEMTATAFQIANLGLGNSFLVEDSDTDDSPFVIDSNGNVGIGTTTLAGLLTVGTTTPSLVVAPNGNVGIGTTAPVTKLDAYNSASTGKVGLFRRGIASDNNMATTFGYPYVNIGEQEYKLTGETIQSIGFGYISSAGTSFPPAEIGYLNTGTAEYTNGALIFGTRSVTTNTIVSERMRIDSSGNVGIATTSPRYKLDVWGDFAVGTSTATNIPILYVDTGNNYGSVGIGTTTPYAALTINESRDFAFGSFNERVIDDMEASDLYWTRVASISTSTETSIVKVGSQSLKITASSTEDAVVRKTFDSNQNWSAYERLSFWIYADRMATSTATSTQLLTFQIYDANNPGMINQNINIRKEGRWQYEEITLNSTDTAAYDAVAYIQFRTDFGGIEDINFYIDQIRAYNATERASEMFVDKDGVLVVTGRGGVELVGPAAGSGQLPGVKVGSAVVELGQPLSVNVGGDVGFDYDIQFLNTGLSQIFSEGPLRIVGGDSNHAENLTLTTGGTGDIIVELANASSSFMVTQAAYTTTTAFIINSEISATTSASNVGILFQIISDASNTAATGLQDENVVFEIDAFGSYRYDLTASTPAGDVAENYYVQDQTIEAGNVVCLSEDSSLTVENCSRPYQNNLIGVISDRPALLMAGDIESSRSVALVGRVPVKVSLENGPITIGDPLTSASSTPGVAAKATKAGRVIGIALKEFKGEPFSQTLTENQENGSPNINATGTIMVFINPHWQGNDLAVQENSSGQIVQVDIKSELADIGLVVNEYGTLEVKKLVAEEIEVQRGLTIYDRATNEPYCVYMENGQLLTALGNCGELTAIDLDIQPQPIEAVLASSENQENGSPIIENGANRPCGSDVGVCQIGVQIYEGGDWGECLGAVMPSDEILDEVDNDCDGEADEIATSTMP